MVDVVWNEKTQSCLAFEVWTIGHVSGQVEYLQGQENIHDLGFDVASHTGEPVLGL